MRSTVLPLGPVWQSCPPRSQGITLGPERVNVVEKESPNGGETVTWKAMRDDERASQQALPSVLPIVLPCTRYRQAFQELMQQSLVRWIESPSTVRGSGTYRARQRGERATIVPLFVVTVVPTQQDSTLPEAAPILATSSSLWNGGSKDSICARPHPLAHCPPRTHSHTLAHLGALCRLTGDTTAGPKDHTKVA